MIRSLIAIVFGFFLLETQLSASVTANAADVTALGDNPAAREFLQSGREVSICEYETVTPSDYQTICVANGENCGPSPVVG